VDVVPSQAHGLSHPKTRIQNQQRGITQRLRCGVQVGRFLFPTQDKLPVLLARQQANPRQAIKHSPLMGEAESAPQRRQLAVDRGGCDSLAPVLNVFLDQGFVDLVQPGPS